MNDRLIAIAFGRALKRLRHAREMRQEDLAGAAGIARSHVAHLETAICNPSLWTVFQVARAMNMEPDLLIQEVMMEMATMHVARKCADCGMVG